MAKIFMLLGCLAAGFFMVAAKSCDSPASDVQAKDDSLECTSDSDCTDVKEDCCDCRQGGKKRAIAKQARKAVEAELDIKCADIMCAQVISKDKSCQKKSKCISGQCQLQ